MYFQIKYTEAIIEAVIVVVGYVATSLVNKDEYINFVKQHAETVMVSNYQNADCSLKILIYCLIYHNFRYTFVSSYTQLYFTTKCA